jgi:outer membrane protein assembly factor BamB
MRNILSRFIGISVLLTLFLPHLVYAKRKAPPNVPPVISAGVRYVAPNDNGRRAYVQAFDIATNKKLWELTIFRNFIDPSLEEDVQHVYIQKMTLSDGKLILVAEDGPTYTLDVKTRKIKKLK